MDDDGRSPTEPPTGGDDAGDAVDGDGAGGPTEGGDRRPHADEGGNRRSRADERGVRSPPAVDGTWAAGDREQSLAERFLTAQTGPLMYVRETLVSVVLVGAVGLLLFGVSGIWPPMVAVESGSMQPHMQKGDLVFVTEPGRYIDDDVTFGDTGVVTHERGEAAGYRSFGDYGSVVVYDNPARGGPPIIHRARFHVEAGENWYDRADEQYVNADDCQELAHCPAEHAGFITRGDNNDVYDQEMGLSPPVKPEWITGVARVRVPLLGWIRLYLSGTAVPFDTEPAVSLDAGPSPPGVAAADATAEATANRTATEGRATAVTPGSSDATTANRTATATDRSLATANAPRVA